MKEENKNFDLFSRDRRYSNRWSLLYEL